MLLEVISLCWISNQKQEVKIIVSDKPQTPLFNSEVFKDLLNLKNVKELNLMKKRISEAV